MLTNQNLKAEACHGMPLLQGEMTSKETINIIFNDLENQLMDKREITVDMKKVTFISVCFLERLGKFVEKGKSLDVQIKITGVNPDIYKVFQVARVNAVLNVCL